MQDQLYNILNSLIVKNNISINKDELKLQFSSHPSYPSLHALTGVLDHFSIPNVAMRLDNTKAILTQLPPLFIAQIATDDGDDLVLIEKKNQTNLKITSDTKKSKLLSEADFLNQWNGIIVAIEKDETINETAKNPLVYLFKWSLIIFSIFLIGFIISSYSSLFAQAHLSLSIIGLILSIFIVNHELGLQSAATNSFCNLTEKTSCDAVINSKGAKIFGLFKLSDISIVAFNSYCLCWVLIFVNGAASSIIMPIVTLLAFPFIIYSVYYQYKIVKKWCPLCLAIASVLLLQFVLVLFRDVSTLLAFDLNETVLFATTIITSIGIWSFLKPILIKKASLEKLEIEHYKFKRNFSLFNALYNESESLKSFHLIHNEIVLGNRNAPVTLVIVTSPFCFYCKKAHTDIEKILKQAHGKIKVVIRFNVDVTNKENDLYKIASQVLSIYNTEGEAACLKALDAAYKEDVNLKEWLHNYKTEIHNLYDLVLKEQENWCRDNAINFTPALYLNGKEFPNEYDRTDLLFFIDDLIEHLQIKTLDTNFLVVQQ